MQKSAAKILFDYCGGFCMFAVRNIFEAEITIADGIVTGQLPRRALRLIFEWLDLLKDELMDNWNRLSNSEAAIKIEPLK